MNYFSEIENIIKKNEVNRRVRVIEENNDILTNYWNIGKLLIEAQGGVARAKYGNGLIKEWSKIYTERYGKGYDATNLRKFRQYYITFEKCAPLGRISWSHIREMLPIKDENKRNYYINLCIKNNLSKRELINEIKNNSYERLVNKPEKIEIINQVKITPLDNMQNPIIIKLKEKDETKTEHDLEMIILSQLKYFFSQLGSGFALIDNQHKLVIENKSYYIDILLFNIKLNCYVVVELKLRELRKEDKAQIEFYMEYIDKNIKEIFNNKTIGIIITKKQDKLIANFVGSDNIIPLTYKINS